MSEPRCVLCTHYVMENDECTCKAVCKDYSEFKMTDAMANHIKESEIYDAVNPDHYKQGGIECIYCIKAALGENFIGFLMGNVIKYSYRYKHKNGVEDLKKARWYLDRAIKELTDEER